MTSPSSTSLKPDAELASEPLRALRRGLSRANGFALYVAVVKTPAQRNQLIKLLQEAIPAIRLLTITIKPGTTDILDEVIKQSGGEATGPIMLVGLEEAISTDAPDHPILHSLNLRRPDWPLLVRQPVVFWVPEYLLGILGRAAPDFLDWRSDTLHFPDVESAELEFLQSATWAGGTDTRMPVAARMERIKELESRIATNEQNRDPVILSALVEWLNELGLHLNLLGRIQEARNCFHKAVMICREKRDDGKESVALGNLGNAYRLLGDLRGAKECYEQALIIARKTHNRTIENAMLGNLAEESRVQGDKTNAARLFEQQLKTAREIGDRRSEGNAIEGLALVSMDSGDFYKSIEFHNQALMIYREISDRRNEASVLGNLGVNYKMLGDLPKAIECQQEKLIVVRAIGDRRGEGTALGNLGNAYKLSGDIHSAIGFFEQHLNIAREIGDRSNEGKALGNLGNAYSDLGEIAKAIDLYEQTNIIGREIGDLRMEAYSFWNLAVAFEKMNNREGAIICAEESLNIFKSLNDSRAGMVSANLAAWRKEASSTPTAAV